MRLRKISPRRMHRRARKAQLAMDFLFTYGWAFLAMLVVLAALVYFGIRDVQKFVPDQCAFLSGLNCLDVLVSDTDNSTYPSAVKFVVRNELGFDISNISISIEGTCDSVMNLTGEIVPTSLMNKEEGTFGFACQNLTNAYLEEKVAFEFTNTDTGNRHRKVGYIRLKP